MSVYDRSKPSGIGNRALPGANAAAVVTLAANANYLNVIGWLSWSYDGAPTGGNLKIEDVAGTVVFSIDITAAGPGMLQLTPPLRNAALNTALIATLSAGGGGVTGKLSVLAWLQGSP